jgi:hypothetical protein
MKQIIKIALLLLLVGSGQYLFAQNAADKASLLVGKWKLTAHWVEHNGKPEYAPVKGVTCIYELKEDGTYILNQTYKNRTSVENGNWRLDDLQQTIIFYNSRDYSSEYGNLKVAEIHHRIYKLTPNELRIEAVYYTEEKGTSMYKRVE